MSDRRPIFFSVPVGTPASKCKGPSCGKTIYYITTARGRMMPIDCGAPECHPPKDAAPLLGEADAMPGRGVPHFGTCPDVELFNR